MQSQLRVLFLFAAVCAAASAFSISGHVSTTEKVDAPIVVQLFLLQNHLGAPVPLPKRAVLGTYGHPSAAATTLAASDGSFAFGDVPTGNYTIFSFMVCV